MNDTLCNTGIGSAVFSGNQFGQLQKEQDPNGAANYYQYDDLGRPTQVVLAPDTLATPTRIFAYRPASQTGSLFWVHEKQQDGIADPTNDGYRHRWSFYDGFGRVVQTHLEAENTQHVETSFAYTWRDAVQRESVPRLVAGSVAVDTTSPTAYQSPGTWTTLNHTFYLYDNVTGRLTQATNPDNTTARTRYNLRFEAITGNTVRLRTAQLDANDHLTIKEQDAFGRTLRSQQFSVSYPGEPDWNAAAHAQATYEYDVSDHLLKTTGPDRSDGRAAAVTTITYDGLGRKDSMADADMGQWQYRYDAHGNLTKQRDANNRAICLFYDALDRLRGKTYHSNISNLDTLACPGQPYAVAYNYDEAGHGSGVGRRTSMTDASGRTDWTYDVRGRVTAEAKTFVGVSSFSTTYTYYDDDQVKTTTYPDGETVTNNITVRGLLGTLVGSAYNTTYVASTAYDALGRSTSLGYGDGSALTYSYDTVGKSYRLTGIQAAVGGASLLSLGYTYDRAGNLTTLTDGGNAKQCFVYDALDRLSLATTYATSPSDPVLSLGCSQRAPTGGDYREAYGYDKNGNLTSRSLSTAASTQATTYGYQDPAHKHALTHFNGEPTARYQYDAAGNQTQRTTGGASSSLSYDAENRLAQVTSGNGPLSYVYDGDGQLVKKVAPEGTTLYVGAHYEVLLRAAGPGTPPTPPPGFTRKAYLPIILGGCVASFVNGQPAATSKYYLAGGQRVALRNGCDTDITYLYRDQLGSTLSTNAMGDEHTRYYPYGGLRSGGSLKTSYRFTGQRQDSQTNLYWIGSRWYDPSLGRWIQPDTIIPDPSNPQTLNRYTYANNSPLTYIDKDGHFAFVPLLIIGGIALLKAVDYGWTAYDSYQSLKVVNDPNASEAAKAEAQGNLVLTVGAELADPDEFLPVSLPIDDLARHGALAFLGTKAAKEAGERSAREVAQQATQGLIDPSMVCFSQSSISYHFKDKAMGTIDDLAEGLRSGRVKPTDVPAIRVMEKDGKLFTLDNRRLEAFRRAGIDVPYRYAAAEEIASEGWKFTTTSDGLSIIVKGGP